MKSAYYSNVMCFRWQKAPHTHRRAMLTFFTVVIWSQALSQPISSQQHENVCWTSPCTFLSCWVCRGACSSSRRLLCAGHSVQNGWGERMEGLFFCFFVFWNCNAALSTASGNMLLTYPVALCAVSLHQHGSHWCCCWVASPVLTARFILSPAYFEAFSFAA